MLHDAIRQAIEPKVIALHAATAYASVPLVLPNMPAVDIEDLTLTRFVDVIITADDVRQAGMATRSVKIDGVLEIGCHIRAGLGTKFLTDYTDMLQNDLGLTLVSGITFRAVSPSEAREKGGWVSVFNMIPFFAYNNV